MIKEGEHLEGVEPINEKIIKNSAFLKIMQNKIINDEAVLTYLTKLLNGRDVLDKSGYSGSSTIIVNTDDINKESLVIKIQPKDSLKEEFIAYNYFYKNKLAPKPLKYFDCGKYEFMIVKKINLPTAGNYFNNFQEIALFFGKELRKFHDLNLKKGKFTKEELKVFSKKFIKSFDEALKNETGLIYSSMYMDDYDYDKMKKDLQDNKNYLFDDAVVVHGDFNPNNVFVDKEGIALIDFKDSGFADRHYDIFWTMFMLIIFSGILADKKATLECEKIFLDSYGRDLIVEEKLTFFKKFACMYWKRHDEITRIDIL
ncbi:MAG: hypothetical protein E7161_00675 [Firmicutes bacterium]|nr:hypothetical protein [Bacillota bacterium]